MNWLDRLRTLGAERTGDEEPLDPALSRLLERARDLPASRQPERDLFLGIAHRIANRGAVGSGEGWSLAALFPRPLAAASVGAMLVATTALSVLWAVQPSAAPPSDIEVTAIAERLRQRDGVSEVHQRIVAILETHSTELPANTVSALEENLRSIDRAIAEIHLAFESNPGHHALRFLLAEAYQREADLLERLEWWTRSPEEVQS